MIARRPAQVPAMLVRGAAGAVASPHHLATGIGVEVLRRGGSAVDAAIATNAALAVVSGYACGLGGDAFWLIWDPAEGRAVALNGSGRSARRASLEAARAAGLEHMPLRGPWSVTVPGAVASWADAHARFGRLSWHELLAPAVALAAGFPASAAWAAAVERAALDLGVDGDWARVYRPLGRPWRAGEMVRLPALSRTLRLIAEEGASVAYEGAVGRRTAAYLEAAGCPIRTDDLAAHRSDWGEPVALGYRGVTCLSHPPNSVGVIALQTLGILDRFPAPAAAAFDGDGCHDARWVHLGLEASRLALAERDATIADPERTAPGAVEALLSAERLDDLAGHLDPDARLEPSRTALPRGGGTVHLATADAGGGLVSMLESNYLGFGSGLVDPETGIAFQNRGSFFSLDPTHPNALAPATRTLHTLTPGLLVRDGRPWIAHGSMGGEIQPQVFAQFVSAIVDGGLDIATAIAAPRWAALMEAHRGAPSTSALEEGYDDAVAEGLASRGHRVLRVERWAAVMGHANAVEVVRASDGEVETTFAAASDPRSEGLPGAC